MVMYATPTELAGFMQQDLDTYTATQVLTLASTAFSSAADTWFAAQSTTYVTTGTRAKNILLPFHPVAAVSAVRINTVVVTGWAVIGQRLYRSAGFGSYSPSVPDLLEVDLTYGYSSVPDDVKKAVLESAAGTYAHPDAAVTSEAIDDYKVTYAEAAMPLSTYAQQLARMYRGSWIL